jgi:hypothetical protein
VFLFCFWHIAKFFCNAKLGRYRGVADIEQASPRSIWLKLPTSRGVATSRPAVAAKVGEKVLVATSLPIVGMGAGLTIRAMSELAALPAP